MSEHRPKRVAVDMKLLRSPPKKCKSSVVNAKYFSTEKENVKNFQEDCEGIEHNGLYFLSFHKLTLTEEPKLIAAQDILRPDKHVVRLTYIGQIEGEPILDEEHSSYLWLSAEEIKNKEGLDQYFKEVFAKLSLG